MRETCISDKSPGDADAAGPMTTFQGHQGSEASPVPTASALTWFRAPGPPSPLHIPSGWV